MLVVDRWQGLQLACLPLCHAFPYFCPLPCAVESLVLVKVFSTQIVVQIDVLVGGCALGSLSCHLAKVILKFYCQQ